MPIRIERLLALLAAADEAQQEVFRLCREIEIARQHPDANEALLNLEIVGGSRLNRENLLLVQKEKWKNSETNLARARKEAKRIAARRREEAKRIATKSREERKGDWRDE